MATSGPKMVYCGKARRGIKPPPLESERFCTTDAREILLFGTDDRGNDNNLSTRHLRVEKRHEDEDAYDDADATIAREARDPRFLDATVVESNIMLFGFCTEETTSFRRDNPVLRVSESGSLTTKR